MARDYQIRVCTRQYNKTVDDINRTGVLLRRFSGIPVGANIWLPKEIVTRDTPGEYKRVELVKYKVIDKNARMIVCRCNAGYRMCFTYQDLLVMAYEYGGIDEIQT